MGSGLEVNAGGSDGSGSLGVERRSKEVEEEEVGAEVEKGDLVAREMAREDSVLVLDDRCSVGAENASLFDVRRAEALPDSLSSTPRCGVYSPSESFLFLFLWFVVLEAR